MRLVALIFIILIINSEEALSLPRDSIGGKFIFNYEESEVRPFKNYRNSELKHKVNELFAEIVSSYYWLPNDIEINYRACGDANAFYDYKIRRITVCYELITQILRAFISIYPTGPDGKPPLEVFSRRDDTMIFILYHEIAHALIDQLVLPVVGKEENAADQLAALLFLRGFKQPDMLVSVVINFALMMNKADSAKDINSLPFWDEHGLDAQRMYDILCMIYGSNPEQYRHLVEKGQLPAERAKRCPREFSRTQSAWLNLLSPHIARKAQAKKEYEYIKVK